MTKKSKVNTSITVTVSKIGEEVKTIALEEGATVEDALTIAGYAGHSARVNDEAVDLDDTLEDGDDLWVGSSVKGGR